ncbi:hypothetical protein B2J88_44640 [Rhodococcus sp. SRB_17]|uniref:TfpX/TfpZ family type IV pilin accessory protein n=1 Tax=Acidovorax sp. SRB_24 TaxID=1962700 RepID=UPI00145FA3DA|nr:TfpX/TfpZ family type IV pilin accessory protein [Acidovorax sp. SRB_24]NMM78975.1 hypothetical protein [Acidovorax sp. SRB_24]NMM91316.1 hypothetical protein [Rhodococcus sp. SRB_17]
MNFEKRLKAALPAAGWHLLGSALIAALLAVPVFGLWYPYPYRELAGGLALFCLLAGVDVVCGPLLTLVLFNPQKPRTELLRDLALVAVIQLGALGYGLWTVTVARPVHVVFETDRFRLVTAAEIDAADLQQAPDGLRQLPWGGPTLISVREPLDGDELLKSVELSLAGQDPSLRPGWWQAYAVGLPQVLERARPLTELAQARLEKNPLLEKAVRKSGMPASDLLWLPLTSARTMEWVVLLDKATGQPRAYAPIDGFR